MMDFDSTKIKFDIEAVLWNRIIPKPAKHIKNTICLLVKQFIYRQRCLQKDISIVQFKKHVYNIKGYEKYYALKNNKINKHLRKWGEERTL